MQWTIREIKMCVDHKEQTWAPETGLFLKQSVTKQSVRVPHENLL